jgi:hypothetical protein
MAACELSKLEIFWKIKLDQSFGTHKNNLVSKGSMSSYTGTPVASCKVMHLHHFGIWTFNDLFNQIIHAYTKN